MSFFVSAKAVFWHSSAHIMGEAMERHYGGHLCYGPPIEEGYYYDMFCEGRFVSIILMYYFSVLKDFKARSFQSFPVAHTNGSSVTWLYIHCI